MIKNTRNQYGSLSKFFHWGIFILVLFMLLSGFFIDSFPKENRPFVMLIHKSTGLLILAVMILRLLWRWINETPSLPEKMAQWEKFLFHIVTILFYITLFLLPITGWMMSTAADKAPLFYGLFVFPMPGIAAPNESLAHLCSLIHEKTAFAFLVLLTLHIAGALKHHFINKDNVLRRMISNQYE